MGFDSLWQDFRFALRVLTKNKAFTLIAALMLALGIGANTAIFSVMHAVLLEPLPYKDPQRLTIVASDMRKRSVNDFPLSNANFMDLRNNTKNSFEALAAVRTNQRVVPAEDGTSEQVTVGLVTPNFFSLMGAHVIAGRDFQDDDARPQPAPAVPANPVPTAAPASGAAAAAAAAAAPPAAPAAPPLPTIAILSYEYFQRRFGGNRGIVGQTILFPGTGPQVVGILQPGFEILMPPQMNILPHPDYWIAARMNYDAAQRMNVSWQVVGRLKDGARLESAQGEVDGVAADLRQHYAIQNTAGMAFRVEPMQKYLSAGVAPVIVILMGAVVFLLLIACANVANLLLVRASLRERELAVRAALGGNRWRLLRQMLAEALVLAAIGTGLGLALAWAGIKELIALAPANLPRLQNVTIDANVLGFTLAAGFAAAMIFGLAPALFASRPDLFHVLRSGGRSADSGTLAGKLRRNVLVVAEVALTFVLLTGSGLMIRSFIELQHIDPGYDPHKVLSFLLLGGRNAQNPQQAAEFIRETQRRLKAIPGVEAVTASTPFPLAGGYNPIRWGTEEALADNSKFKAVDWQVVLPGYFEAMKSRLIDGRTFTDADNVLDSKKVLIDDMLAAKAYPHQSAIGKRILIRLRTPEPEWVEIIGVVGHQRDTTLAEAGREQIYFTDSFLSYGAVARWALRTNGDPATVGDAVRATVSSMDPKILIAEMQPMETLVTKSESATRFSLLLIGIFAAIAVVLASVGLYGVLSTVVRQRTAEIGVRMALGARPMSIFNLVVGHGMRLTIAGLLVGIIAAFALTRAMTSMLVGVAPTDPATFFTMALAFLVIAVMAAWLPARRAANLAPTVALREE